MVRKSHKRNIKIEPHKRKKPTVAKRVSHQFRSRHVKPTRKERIMAKAPMDTDAPHAAPTEAPKTDAPQTTPLKDDLLSLLENAYRSGGPVTPHMIELAKGGSK